MSKKNPKKAGADGDNDPQAEMALLRKQLEESEHQLQAEKLVVEQLRSINADQAKQLAASETLLKSETEKHSAEMWVLYDETTSTKDSLQHENQVLNSKVQELEAEAEGFRVLEEENQTLRDRIGSLMQDVDLASKYHADETHRLKKEVFNLRMQLEQTFRKAMQELDAEYKKRALSNLDEESKNALKANARLQSELSMQTDGIQAMMAKYKVMEQEYTKLKIEYDVLQAGHSIQESRIGSLKRAHKVSATQVEELQSTVVEVNKQRIKDLEAELERQRTAKEEAQEELQRTRQRCDALNRKLEATYKKMRHTRRRLGASSSRKGSNAADMSATAPATADANSLPRHPLEGFSFPTITADQSVEAFDAYSDILSIWNANFPGQRPAGGKSQTAKPRKSVPSTTTARSRARRQVGLTPSASNKSVSAALLPKDARRLARSLQTQSSPGLGRSRQRQDFSQSASSLHYHS